MTRSGFRLVRYRGRICLLRRLRHRRLAGRLAVGHRHLASRSGDRPSGDTQKRGWSSAADDEARCAPPLLLSTARQLRTKTASEGPGKLPAPRSRLPPDLNQRCHSIARVNKCSLIARWGRLWEAALETGRAENSVRAKRSRAAVAGAAISAKCLTADFHRPYRGFACGVPVPKSKEESQ